MKTLNYNLPPTAMGGNVFSNAGTIHKSEIIPTLNNLSDVLAIGVDLNNYVVGSVGKREYSGDLDIVYSTVIFPADLQHLLEQNFEKKYIKKSGNQIHLLFPIVEFDETKDEIGPRTGYVQVDFKTGDIHWLKFYNYTDENSAYKSAHRNLAIAAICKHKDNFFRLDDNNEVVEEVRYKFSDHGFNRVLRQKVWNTYTNKYNKSTRDINIGDTIYNENQIRSILFNDSTPDDLKSLETLIDAVNRNFSNKEDIFRTMAKNFSEWADGKFFKYPSEIEPFMNVK